MIDLKEFTVDSINFHVWELGIEFEIALTDGGELTFDKYFLHFNVRNIYVYIYIYIYDIYNI